MEKIQNTLNIEDVKKTYQIVAHNNESEIRLIDPHKKEVPKSIFCKSETEFIKACEENNGKYNIYVGINERTTGGKEAKDVVSVKTIVIDIDPERETNTASTEQELQTAIDLAKFITDKSVEYGFSKPSVAMSGNGIQLWFTFPEIILTLENRLEVEGKVKKFIYNLQKRFNNKDAKIDQIGDLPRIIKVMGTLSIKGEHTIERPHRISKWINYYGRVDDKKFQEDLLTLEPIKSNETSINPDKKESRSETEFGAICAYIKKGLNKQEVFTKMMAYAKWANPHHPNYREHTYNKALDSIKKQTIDEKGKKKIVIPGFGRLISEWVEDISKEIKTKNELFYRIDAKEIIQIGKIKILDEEEETYTGFIQIKPNQFITILEKYITPGHIVKDKENNQFKFKSKSITNELASTTLASDILKQELPQLQRIFTIPIPILYEGKITFPNQGYDKRFGSWLPYDAPTISEPNMELEEAKEIIKTIFEEFCFEEQQDAHNAIAGLLTPFLRGLFPKFSTRTPVFFYLANRERAGKDYCAGITGIVYEGFNLEEAPISNADKHNNNSEELRKKLLSSMIGGRKRMHFSNNKGYIDNAVFEAITTTEKYTDRILGKNESLVFDNELDFSLSGNVGVGFTPDFSNRCRFVRLFLEIENANSRKFNKSDLHGWVLQNRSRIISALYCLVRNWEDKGCPEGKLSFASFSSWAKICGGIMEAAGYKNPCEIDKNIVTIAGDAETTDMKTLFEEMYKTYQENEVQKDAILTVVHHNDLFPNLDLIQSHGDKTKFGNLLTKYIGRVLSDIRLEVKNPNDRPSRREYVFTKKEHVAKIIEF